MVEPGAFFEVADGEFDGGVVAVEPVSGDGAEVVSVGDEGVVPPVGPQPLLGCVGEAGAAHHQTDAAALFAAAGAVDGFSDLGVAAVGVVDIDPGFVGDRLDGRACQVFCVRGVV